MEKKIAGFYIKVPCIDNVGSCIYHNVCTNSTEASPDYFKKYGLSGKCPSLPAGTYSASNVVEHIAKKLPAGAAGDFRITVNPLSGAVGQLGCIQVQLNLSD
jgi:ganglioside GM2 activator